MYDKKQDGLCCHYEAGSYKLSVDDVLVRGNKFDDAAIVVRDSWDPDYLFHAHEFCYDQHPLQQKWQAFRLLLKLVFIVYSPLP